MKWIEIAVETSHEATEAVAQMFQDLGSGGVVIEDPTLVNAYRQAGAWDYCDIPAPLHPDIVTVKAYWPADEGFDTKLRTVAEQLDRLADCNLDKGTGLIQYREIQEEDWASSWKQYFHPVKIGERIVVKPSWEAYTAAANDIVLELDPGMAFGTGTHPTTAMCCRCLENLVQADSRVFDIGTGSGILAVAAAKLGAANVQAVDLDAVAVRVARDNIAANQVAAIVGVAQGDLLTGVAGQADIIIANIIADIIIQLLPDIPARLQAKGYFIASGIIAERLPDVEAAVQQQALLIETIVEEGGWVALVVRKEALDAPFSG